ncbi:MAG TPA: hypothetical protein VFP47_18730, partial [Pyrinomonadaceae bacterium]|nr:hypothetical protein [Pyrinomonadaceae bacterium]
VIGMNKEAYAKLTCEKQLKIVPGATHLFEEPGTLEQVAQLASTWFKNKLQPRASAHGTCVPGASVRLLLDKTDSDPQNFLH